MQSGENSTPSTEAEIELDASQFKMPVKPLIVFGVLLLGVLIVYLSPLKHYLQHIRDIKEQLRSFGLAGPLIYMAGVLVLISLGFPRLLFCPIGGIAFGFFQGLVWTQIPTLVGYYAIFLFVRWGGRDFVIRHWPRVSHMHAVFTRNTIPTILVIRQLPISGLIINLFLGLSPIRHRDFLIATAIGLLPEAIPFTLVGSSAGKYSVAQSAACMVAAIVVLLVVWLSFWLIARKSKLFDRVRGQSQNPPVS